MYGQAPLVGSTIDPRLFIHDFSTLNKANELKAQGTRDLGNTIAQGITQVGDYFKQQGEKKKLIKKSDVQIDAALKLFPDLAPTLQGVRDQIRDENVPLDDRAAIADSVAGLINMGTNQMRFQSEQGMQQQRLGLERMQYETSASRAQRELDLKISEQEQKNYAASAEAIGSLAALKSVEEKTGKKFVPDEISSSVNKLAQSGQGQAAANLISKYSAGLDPAIKAEFQAKKTQTPVNINLPQGGTQQMVLNAEGVYEPIQVAEVAVPNDAGVLPDIELPLTATQPDGTPLTLNDVPRGAEKTQEIDVNGKKFDVYVDKNSPPEPVDVFGVTLPGFETAPREQWTPSKKFLIPRQEEQRQTPTIGPGTVGYAPEKTMRPTKTPEEELQTQRWTTLDKLQSDIRATGVAAAQDIAPFKEISGLLDTNVKTGFGRQTIMTAKKVLGADVSNDEQFQARVGELAMRNIALTKGAISDREMDYFKTVLSPNMGKTTEGNKKIIEFKIKYAERADTIAKTISKMQSQGADPYAIQSEIDKIIESTPLVTVGSTPTSQSSQAESDASFIQGFQSGE
jgi:hypothetical protein